MINILYLFILKIILNVYSIKYYFTYNYHILQAYIYSLIKYKSMVASQRNNFLRIMLMLNYIRLYRQSIITDPSKWYKQRKKTEE